MLLDVLSLPTLFGLIRQGTPLGANVAGLVFVVSGLHVLYVNRRFLPPALRPPRWRQAALVLLTLFYGFFVYLWLVGGLTPDYEKGFLFNLPELLGIKD